jgi:hypothetical protein
MLIQKISFTIKKTNQLPHSYAQNPFNHGSITNIFIRENNNTYSDNSNTEIAFDNGGLDEQIHFNIYRNYSKSNDISLEIDFKCLDKKISDTYAININLSKDNIYKSEVDVLIEYYYTTEFNCIEFCPQINAEYVGY